MWGEKTKQVIISSMAILFVCAFSSARGADNPTAATAVTDQEDPAVKAEFDKVYQELLKTDPNAAEMFEKEFKAYEDGEYVEHDWDPEKAEEEYQKAYQELLEKNPEEAAKMQEMHEKFQEWEKGGRAGPPPFEHEHEGAWGEHEWKEGDHPDFEHMNDSDRAEYEKMMQEHEHEYEHPETEQERPEFEREHEREDWKSDQRYDEHPPQ